MDEHSGNWSSIEKVFGSEGVLRTFSCEFHFKQSLVKHARKVAIEDRDMFKYLGTEMMIANTECEYIRAADAMSTFCERYLDVLSSWLKWWKMRARHIFRAFKPIATPNSNYAEIGHAMMVNVFGGSPVSLIESCRNDVVMFTKQKVDIEAFKKGLIPRGRGQNKKEARELSHKRQMQCAKAYSRDLTRSPVDEAKLPRKKFVAKVGIHRPIERRPKAKKKTAGKQGVEREGRSRRKMLTGPNMMMLSPKVYSNKRKPAEHDVSSSPEIVQSSSPSSSPERTAHRRKDEEIDNNYDPGPTTFTKPYHNNNKFLVVLNHVDGSRKCPGCDVEFENEAKPPHNMVIQHSERYSYPDPKNKELKKWSVTKERKMNYHARDTCILPRHPYFNASRLEMTDEVKKAMQPIHSKFLLDNFENVGM